MLSTIWVSFLLIALLAGALGGNLDAVTAAVTDGAGEAVKLSLSLVGLMGFWSGVMALVERSGLAGGIARALQPLLRPLFGKAAEDTKTMELIGANVTANLLGLSNAATPLGLRAAERLHQTSSSDAVLSLIVLNTTSLQIIPTTVAAIRASCGAAAPYDIMPAVWLASAGSIAAALLTARLLRRIS